MRYMVAKYGHPDYLITEFVSVDALHHATGERRERLLKTFVKARDVGEIKPLDHLTNKPFEIAQIFGHEPEYFKEAAELIESLGFDGIDINMGCPMHKVEDQGSGAGLIRTPELAKEIVLAVNSATKLPVSVKTRIGVDKDIAEEWMEHLMEVKPVRISLHGATCVNFTQV
jgi:tRNA-dihydrouridine synthase